MEKLELMKLIKDNILKTALEVVSIAVDIPVVVYSLINNDKTRQAAMDSLSVTDLDILELQDKLVYVLKRRAKENIKVLKSQKILTVAVPEPIIELVENAVRMCDDLEECVDTILQTGLDSDEMQQVLNTDINALENDISFDEDEYDYERPVVTDLVGLSKLNKVSSILGRDTEINSIIETLGRKNSKGVLLTGDSGVGKTAIVEELARRIAVGQVPSNLINKKIFKVNIPMLVATLKTVTELLNAFESIIIKAQDENAIVYFDDLALLSRLDSVTPIKPMELIKPYIEDGRTEFIGIVNTTGYKSVKGDATLLRLVQEIAIKETSVEDTLNIVQSKVKEYRKYHKIKIDTSTLEELVKLTDKHIRDRVFPDKAFYVLDSACAKATSSGCNTLAVKHIKETISSLIGVDINKLDREQKTQLMTLDKRIKSKLIGQDLAVDKVVKSIKRNRVGFSDTNRPIGTFMFIGKTGVGKTELCKVLAKEMFGSDKAIIKLDMSEYSEKHNLARLLGAPPGYIGYDDSSVLADSIRNKPYSVVLFDEIEKAHPDVFNILLQILEDGTLTTGKGEKLYFNNAIIVMTSNIGQEKNNKRSIGFSTQEDTEKDITDDREYLKPYFKPEIINRIDTVIRFNSLSKEDIYSIVKLELSKSISKVQEIKVTYGSSLVKYIAEKGYDETYGARTIRRIVQDEVEGYIADLLLDNRVRKGDTVLLSYRGNGIKHKVSSLSEEDTECIVPINKRTKLNTQTNG